MPLEPCSPTGGPADQVYFDLFDIWKVYMGSNLLCSMGWLNLLWALGLLCLSMIYQPTSKKGKPNNNKKDCVLNICSHN